jgi:hypothetical protein
VIPPEVLTVTVTLPAACAGVIKVRDVEELTIADTVTPPIVTEVSPITKLVPVIETEVPPAIGPKAGLREVAVGNAS